MEFFAPDDRVAGRVLFREENSDAFFSEITSETPVAVKRTSGQTVTRFELPTAATNEALDCYVMARAAAEVVWSSKRGVLFGGGRKRPPPPEVSREISAAPAPTASRKGWRGAGGGPVWKKKK